MAIERRKIGEHTWEGESEHLDFLEHLESIGDMPKIIPPLTLFVEAFTKTIEEATKNLNEKKKKSDYTEVSDD